MKKVLMSIFVIFVVLSTYLFLINKSSNNIQKSDENIVSSVPIINPEEVVNISDCSEEFMESYFDDVAKLQESDNKENILIVTSLNGISNDFGAASVVEAPNNQYFLQYESQEAKEKALQNFNDSEEILYVGENIVYEIASDEYNSWGIEKMGLDKAIEVTESNNLNEITVAIIDTGLNVTLFNTYYPGRLKETYNALNSGTSVTDSVGHGTHIAGTIAEGTPSNVKILPIKVSNEREISNVDIITAINYIVYGERADVINMSFSGGTYDYNMYVAIEAAKDKNIISVAASGNDGEKTSMYPASYDNTIAISAVGEDLALADFSNYSNEITFTAPGVDIVSINGTSSGTSMATPHAVNAVAIVKSFYPDYTLEEVIEELKKYAIDLGEDGWDDEYGYGFINFIGTPLCELEEGCLFDSNLENFNFIKKIEPVADFATVTNYGNITNILNAEINIYYDSDKYLTKALWELEDLEILNYEPFSYTNQTVILKYKGQECTLNVDNQNATKLYFEYEVTDDEQKTAKITKFSWTSLDMVHKVYVPEELFGYTITEIGDSAFEKQSIEYIIVPETVTKFGDYAFYINYGEVYILADEIEAGNYSFSKTHYLTDFNSTIKALGEYAFESSGIEHAKISEDVELIPTGAFRYSDLKSIELTTNLKEISDSAFFSTKLTSIEIPDGVTTIGSSAFASCSNLESVSISKTVASLGIEAFYNNSNLKTIVVDEENTVYDSRDNSNAIIETASNTLIVGSSNTVIPNTVKIIGSSAFYGKMMTEIEIPEGVEAIKNNAFKNCDNLEVVLLPNTISSIESARVFPTSNENLTLWLYKDTYSETYAKENSINYLYRDTDVYDLKVELPKTDYIAFEEVDTTDLSIQLVYKGEETTYKTYDGSYTISYINGYSYLEYGDEYFTISISDNGREVTKEIPVTVSKAIPEYTVPTDLTAQTYQTLAEIDLPSCFKWMDETQEITEIGNITYKAKYVPSDLNNYEVVENIDIVLAVTKGKKPLTPEIIISDKTYDGTTDIDINSITINNMDNAEYTIESVTLSTTEVGDATATIKLKLSDDAFVDYKLENGVQEKTYYVDMKIVPQKVVKPTLEETTYVYTGASQHIKLKNLDRNTMRFIGLSGIDAGEYTATISLISTNYVWEDGTTDDLTFTFTIEKGIPEYVIPTDLEVEKGQYLSEITLPDGFEWKYANTKVSATGTYKANYVPDDTDNYEIVYDIDIPVTVIVKEVLTPNFVVTNKTYDGTTNIDLSSITISNLNSEDYTIESAVLSSSDAGKVPATVTVKLSDTAFKKYTFLNGKREQSFDVNVTVEPLKIQKPTKVDKIYTYNGNEQEFELNNFDSTAMIIDGNKRTDAGEQTVTVSLISSNYMWDDATTNDLTFDFVIAPLKILKPTKVDKKYTYNGSEQEFELNGFDSNIMLIEGNKRTNAGEQTVIVSLINSNYIWDDDITADLNYDFVIEKAVANVEYNSSDNIVSYDGNTHGIIINITSPVNAKIRYVDEAGNYTLETMPEYKDIGIYTIKYRIYIDNNYTDIFGENILTIKETNIQNNSTDYEGMYDGEAHSINIDINVDNYTIKYSIDSLDYNLDELPMFTEVGEYTVNYKVTCDTCSDLTGSNKVKIFGIEQIDDSLEIKDNVLVIRTSNNAFDNVSNLIKVFAKNYSYEHYDKNNNLDDSNVTKTGDEIRIIINDSNIIEYNISIIGDVTGDGIVNIADVIKIADHSIQQDILIEDYEKISAEVTGDNMINIADVVKIADYTLDNSINIWR